MISKSIESNREEINRIFNESSDLVLYEFNTLSEDRALVVYIEGLIDNKVLNEDLLKPLIQYLIIPQDILSTVFISKTKKISSIQEVIQPITDGEVILFIENMELAYIFDLNKWENRAITEPGTERVVRGPKEGFIEDIKVNKVLIRRKVRNSKLVFEDYTLGVQTNTKISLAYINGIVKQEILDELRRRIQEIQIDSILDTGYLERYIEDAPRTVICTIGHSEKPDVVVGKILEGRIAIICDGSPDVLTVPKVFIENLQMADDYYSRPQYATFLRILRLFALITSVVLPGFFVALKTFHQEMIPAKLLVSMAKNIEEVPFTALVEALLMILFFELIKESGLRIPNNIGTAVTVVSGIVLGQTAVQAGLVGPIMVIVIAIAGISEFIIPSQREMIVIYRLIILLLGGFLGLYGIVCGISIILVHLISLKSFGVPYMYPIAPYDKEGMKDFIFMRSVKETNYRPRALSNKKAIKRNEIYDKK
ncbi:spore germination protein KA [Tissierella praeacuta DSM 18095]|uniref:Spore germination protein KA n=1 Tax=Tissierella praeacuta DSM 18095 TaxID=1123404 RepID=A0A1M4V5M4_9FIRM|nr:spore germination protein [Tissierella praeacuta]TCU74087.1 spore germination protein KA [Tissierella praeacuta]SHE64207.1 spore germination protein KA [Tissierella praeacuta DSM 18095]SUP02920.1 Bacillus/Clostridium GerA spore germination protein [Tissierella praeacuta]